jgi:hypothetical protein
LKPRDSKPEAAEIRAGQQNDATFRADFRLWHFADIRTHSASAQNVGLTRTSQWVKRGNQLALFVFPFWVNSRYFPMSALPPKADIAGRQLDVCFAP